MNLALSQRDKLISLTDAARLIKSGDTIACGGSFLQRTPAAFVRELVRSGKKDLTFVKPSPGYDVDLLCAGKALSTVMCGIVSFDEPYGLAPNYRRAVEEGAVRLVEHACITVASGLRAAAQNIPFMPLPEAAMMGSDIPLASGMLSVRDPYTGKSTLAIARIDVDWAIVHAAKADAYGNASIPGAMYWDRLMVRSAKHVVVTTEEVVSAREFQQDPRLTSFSGYYVDAVVCVPQGAAPTAFEPFYSVDDAAIREYIRDHGTPLGLDTHLSRFAAIDHREYNEVLV